jgi:hypothetical protein
MPADAGLSGGEPSTAGGHVRFAETSQSFLSRKKLHSHDLDHIIFFSLNR